MIVVAVAGEHDASAWAGVATLVGVLLGVLAAAAAYEGNKSKDHNGSRSQGQATAWMLAFAALFFASFGTAIGLWGLVGSIGRVFIITSLVITVAVAGLIIWRKQLGRQAQRWRIRFLKEVDTEQRHHDPNEQKR